MRDLTLQNAAETQIMAMADGLARAGDFTLAARLYKSALKSAKAEERQQLQVRYGLATSKSAGRASLLDMLRDTEATGANNVFVADGLATWNKTLPFCDDARFMALAEKHAHLLPIANWHWNLHTVLWAINRARNIDGEFVELGVFKGHTTAFLADYVEFQTWPKTWRLYDTFEGIPEDQLDPGWATPNRNVYGGTFSFEEVRQRFEAYPNIEVIKGRVPEIFDTVAPDRIAFLHMDLNNSTAEIAALDALYDRISPGGVIIFDDFAWLTARVQYNAERRWFAERGLEILAIPTGQGVFVKPA